MRLVTEWLKISGFTTTNFFSNGDEPPDEAGVYVFAAENHVQYVGSSKMLSKRLRYHEAIPKLEQWTLWWKVCENHVKEEKSLIRELDPVHNVQWKRRNQA